MILIERINASVGTNILVNQAICFFEVLIDIYSLVIQSSAMKCLVYS